MPQVRHRRRPNFDVDETCPSRASEQCPPRGAPNGRQGDGRHSQGNTGDRAISTLFTV